MKTKIESSPAGAQVATERFYHYTCVQHWNSIQSDGAILTTESNVSFEKPHAGPDVVWMVKEPLTRYPAYLQSSVDKMAVRIEVELPKDEVQRSDKWLRRHGATDGDIKALEKAGGAKASTWFVIARPIVKQEWKAVLLKGIKLIRATE